MNCHLLSAKLCWGKLTVLYAWSSWCHPWSSARTDTTSVAGAQCCPTCKAEFSEIRNVALENRHKIEVPFTFLLSISFNSCNSLLSSRWGCHVIVHPRVRQIPELQFEIAITRLQIVHYTTHCTDEQRGFLLLSVWSILYYIFLLNIGSEKLTELVRKHKERYGVLNSQYSENLRKEKFSSRLSKKWNRQAANSVDSSGSYNGVWLIDTNFSVQLCPSSNFKRNTTFREPSLPLSSGK
jgi:hypothetical protein